MTKIIRYLKLLEVSEDLLNLYYNLYTELTENNEAAKIKNKWFIELYKSKDINFSYIKIYAYYKVNLIIYFVLDVLVNLQFIKDKTTNSYINFLDNTIEIKIINDIPIKKLNQRKKNIIKISDKDTKQLLHFLLPNKTALEIDDIKNNNNKLNEELAIFKCNYLIQRRNKPLKTSQLDDAYQNFIKDYKK